jgi:hypothetical protein
MASTATSERQKAGVGRRMRLVMLASPLNGSVLWANPSLLPESFSGQDRP